MRKYIFSTIISALVILVVVGSVSGGVRYVGNKSNKKLHDTNHAACSNYVKKMSSKNKKYFKSKAAANKAGYKSCKKC